MKGGLVQGASHLWLSANFTFATITPFEPPRQRPVTVHVLTTPKVQYAYTEMADAANHSRLVSMTYPNGRVLTSNCYGPNCSNHFSSGPKAGKKS